MTDTVFLIVYLPSPLAKGLGDTVLVTKSTPIPYKHHRGGYSDPSDALITLMEAFASSTSAPMMARNSQPLRFGAHETLLLGILTGSQRCDNPEIILLKPLVEQMNERPCKQMDLC